MHAKDLIFQILGVGRSEEWSLCSKGFCLTLQVLRFLKPHRGGTRVAELSTGEDGLRTNLLGGGHRVPSRPVPASYPYSLSLLSAVASSQGLGQACSGVGLGLQLRGRGRLLEPSSPAPPHHLHSGALRPAERWESFFFPTVDSDSVALCPRVLLCTLTHTANNSEYIYVFL